MLTDRTERFLAAELVREQLFLLRQEMPYAIAVVIEELGGAPERKGDVVIDASILVERDRPARASWSARADDDPRRSARSARGEISELLAAARAPQASRQGRPRLDHVARARWRAGVRAMTRARVAGRQGQRGRGRPRPAAGRAGRAAQRRQVVAVQPAGRRPARAGRGRARRDARSPLRRVRLGRRRASASSTPAASIRRRRDPGGDARSRPCAPSTRPTSWCSWSTRARA